MENENNSGWSINGNNQNTLNAYDDTSNSTLNDNANNQVTEELRQEAAEYIEKQQEYQSQFAFLQAPQESLYAGNLVQRKQEIEDEIARKFGARVDYEEFHIGKKTYIVRSFGVAYVGNIFGAMACFGMAGALIFLSSIPALISGRIGFGIFVFLVSILLILSGVFFSIMSYKEFKKKAYERKLIKAGLMEKEPFNIFEMITILGSLFVVGGILFLIVAAVLDLVYGIKVFELMGWV